MSWTPNVLTRRQKTSLLRAWSLLNFYIFSLSAHCTDCLSFNCWAMWKSKNIFHLLCQQLKCWGCWGAKTHLHTQKWLQKLIQHKVMSKVSLSHILSMYCASLCVTKILWIMNRFFGVEPRQTTKTRNIHHCLYIKWSAQAYKLLTELS